MIRFSVSIPNLEKLKTFLANSDLDYITVLATPGIVYFMSETKELYMHYAVQVLSRHNLNDSEIFRLDRKTFASLVDEGVIEFELTDTNIIINFKKPGGALAYSYETIRQIDIIGKFLERLNLLENVNDYPQVNIAQLSGLARMSKSLGYDINCGTDVASIKLGNGFIYSNIESQPFICSGKLINLLLSYTLNVYNVQNYLIFNSSDVVVMVTKHRQGYVPEISFIKEQQTHFIVDFEMRDCISMCKKLHFKEGNFYLDLDEGIAEFKVNKSTYRSTIKVLEVKSRKSKKDSDDFDLNLDNFSLDGEVQAVDFNSLGDSSKYGIPKIEIPFDIFSKILTPIGRNKISIMFKKNFIMIKVKGIFIVFARKDV